MLFKISYVVVIVCLFLTGCVSTNERAMELYRNGKYSEALKIFKQDAEQGDAHSQYCLGSCYFNGEGVARDYVEAAEWYAKAAGQGYADAQYSYGFCLFYGYGVDKDYKAAVELYREAAEQGQVSAQYSLGHCYLNGLGVEKNYTLAVEWYRKAAENGSLDAQYNLGRCYFSGQGVEKDYEEAAKWFKKAAQKGWPNAQTYLDECQQYKKDANGQWLRKSKPVKTVTEPVTSEEDILLQKQYEQAAGIFKQQAEKGDAAAQYNLGLCYHTGFGVKKDLNKALMWYKKSAAQNCARGQNAMAYYYAEQGTNLDEASKYIEKALKQEPDNKYYLDTCGLVLYKQGKYSEALTKFNKALGVKEGEAEVRYHLGCTYLKLGNRNEAERELSRAAMLCDDKELKKNIDQALAAIRK